MPSNAVEDIDVDELFARMAAEEKKANDGNETDSGLDATGDMETEPEDTTDEDSRHAGLDLVTDDIHEDLQADDPVEAQTQTQTQTLNDDEVERATLDALRDVVLPELREHLRRTDAWVGEVMDALSEVSRGR